MNYKIVKHKVLFDKKTNQTYSIFGAMPKDNLELQERGWTLYNIKQNTYGIGKTPFVTYFESLNYMN
jgi:hypothetical protein